MRVKSWHGESSGRGNRDDRADDCVGRTKLRAILFLYQWRSFWYGTWKCDGYDVTTQFHLHWKLEHVGRQIYLPFWKQSTPNERDDTDLCLLHAVQF